MSLITIVGRGHSGTRAIAHTLAGSGVYMGAEHNGSADLIPPEDFYEACCLVGRLVTYLGDGRWDFSRVLAAPVDPAFPRLVESYLASVLASEAAHRGWKLPETVLAYPWMVRVYPQIRYIHWVRDPRDCLLDRHITDDLTDFAIPVEATDDTYRMRALSWLYQRRIVEATPPPPHCLQVRFEDFVLDQAATLERLRGFLGFPLAVVPVRPEAVARWRDSGVSFDGVRELLAGDLRRLGYPDG